MQETLLAVMAALIGVACAVIGPPDRSAEIQSAVEDLGAAGFRFEADVAFQASQHGVCEGLSCADLAVLRGRRRVLIAREAFDSPSRLRATLLEIWGRYRQPRAPSDADQARSALRIVQEGPRAGIDDPFVLRRAFHAYRQLYARLTPGERADLPGPETLPYP